MPAIQTAISEHFLHFIWEKCYFDVTQLTTHEGHEVQIIKPGRYNHDQGPDFLNAEIRIDEVLWHGHVEIHIEAEDWYKHRHHQDTFYNTAILHVAWSSKHKEIIREDGTVIPEIVIGDRIDSSVLYRYDQLRLAQSSIACKAHFAEIPLVIKKSWIERMAIERIQLKAANMEKALTDSKHNWEQVLWEQLASMMGGPVNKAQFLQLAQRIPYRTLQKYHNRITQLEALLFGGCGMLSQQPPQQSNSQTHPEHYYFGLYREWEFLKNKHQFSDLSPIPVKKLRMRPAAFPTIRIAQLAQILTLFPSLIDLTSYEYQQLFVHTSIGVSEYWNTHYQFFETKPHRAKNLGKQQKQILLTNVILPFSRLYYHFHGRRDIDEQIIDTLSELEPENNRITRIYTELDEPNSDALYSQGLIQLYKGYCTEKRCLECAIGRKILAKKD